MSEGRESISRAFFDFKRKIDNEMFALSETIDSIPEDDFSDKTYLSLSRRMDYIQTLFDDISVIMKDLDLDQSNPQLYELLNAKSELSNTYGKFHRARTALTNRFTKKIDEREERIFARPIPPVEEAEEVVVPEGADTFDDEWVEEFDDEDPAEAKKRARAERQKKLAQRGRAQDARNAAEQARLAEERLNAARLEEARRLGMSQSEGAAFSEADLRSERFRQDEAISAAEAARMDWIRQSQEAFASYQRKLYDSQNFGRLSNSHNDLSYDAERPTARYVPGGYVPADSEDSEAKPIQQGPKPENSGRSNVTYSYVPSGVSAATVEDGRLTGSAGRFESAARNEHIAHGSTAHSRTGNPNRTNKAQVEETVANIFSSSSRLKQESIAKAYFKQAGYRIGDYFSTSAYTLSRRMYSMIQEGDDNAIRTLETGRYYVMTGAGVAMALRDRRVAKDLITKPLHDSAAEFKRYGSTSLMSNSELSRSIRTGVQQGQERKAVIREMRDQLRGLDRQIESLRSKTPYTPTSTSSHAPVSSDKLAKLQADRNELSSKLSQLKSEHAAASRVLRKEIRLRDVRAHERLHDSLVGEMSKGGKPPKNLKQMDQFIADFGGARRAELRKKYGDLTLATPKSVTHEIARLKDQAGALKKQIRFLESKGAALSQGERTLLLSLKDKHRKLNETLRKHFGYQQAKDLLDSQLEELGKIRSRFARASQRFYAGWFALQGFILRPLREGGDYGTYGLAKLVEVSSNRYVHILLKKAFKVSYKASLFFGKGALEALAPGSTTAISNSLFIAKTKIGAGKQVIKSAVKKGLKTAVRSTSKGIRSLSVSRIKTVATGGAKVAKASSKFGNVVAGIKNSFLAAKQWFAATKLGQGIAALSGSAAAGGAAAGGAAAGGAAAGGAAAGGAGTAGGVLAIKIIAIACAVIIVLVILSAALTGGSSTTVILSPKTSKDKDTEKIDLSAYVQILNEEESAFNDEMRALGASYDDFKIDYVSNYDNTKEILSMMAVYNGQELDLEENKEVEKYIKSLFDDSHTYTTHVEKFRCAGEDCETKKCETEDCKVKIISSACTIECPVGCPGNHTTKERYCPGDHPYCPGNHERLIVTVKVLGFDEIFWEDSMGNGESSKVAGDLIDYFTITYYCACEICCGEGATGTTATGTKATADRTIAVDFDYKIGKNAHVIIWGKEYIAEDTGGAIKGNRIDIYVDSHEEALQLGKRENVPVYWPNIEGGSMKDSGEWDGWTDSNIAWAKALYAPNWTDLYIGVYDYGGGIIESGDLIVEGDFVWPVTSTSNSSGYGWRTHPITGKRTFHRGTDIPVPTGTPVHAAAAGVVYTARYHPEAGNFIEIDHGNGIVTRYLHNSRLYVSVGDEVEAGEVISLSGNTGASTGPHLHFEFLVNGTPIDPRAQYKLD